MLSSDSCGINRSYGLIFTAINRMKKEGDGKSFNRNRTSSIGVVNPSATCDAISGGGIEREEIGLRCGENECNIVLTAVVQYLVNQSGGGGIKV